MKIRFLGTGSAFCTKNYQTNILIEKNDSRLLIDAGGDIRFSLKEHGLSYKDINSVYVTHLHTDHIGGLEYLAFNSYFDPSMKDKTITLIGNNDLIRELWNTSLKGGLKSIQGKKTTLQDFFDIMMIRKNSSFTWEGVEFKIVQSIHIIDEYAIVPSFGLMFKDPDTKQTIYFTSDMQFCPKQIMDFYKQADIIIQDCETTPYLSGVHANYQELVTLPSEIKEKMLLVHYQDNIIHGVDMTPAGVNNISSEWIAKTEADGFKLDSPVFVPRGYIMDLRETPF